jgi:ABC-type phosphonate transport system ATPase subunit
LWTGDVHGSSLPWLGRTVSRSLHGQKRALIWTGEVHAGDVRSIEGSDLQEIHRKFQQFNATSEFFSGGSRARVEMSRIRRNYWASVSSPSEIEVNLLAAGLKLSQTFVQCDLAKPFCKGKDVRDGIDYLGGVNGNCSAVGTGWGRVSCNGGAAVYWGNIVR